MIEILIGLWSEVTFFQQYSRCDYIRKSCLSKWRLDEEYRKEIWDHRSDRDSLSCNISTNDQQAFARYGFLQVVLCPRNIYFSASMEWDEHWIRPTQPVLTLSEIVYFFSWLVAIFNLHVLRCPSPIKPIDNMHTTIHCF